MRPAGGSTRRRARAVGPEASGGSEIVNKSLSLGTTGATARDRAHTLFGQTMGYVALTTGFFALGAYLGRNLSPGWAIVAYIVGFVCLIAMNFTVRRSKGLTAGLLFAFGIALGL